MEENANAFEEQIVNPEPRLTKRAIRELLSAAKWSRFLAILGFVQAGFLVLLAFSGNALMSFASEYGGAPGIPTFFLTLIYLFVALVYFAISWYLYRFSQKTIRAINSEESASLESGLISLNGYFRIKGIISIVVVSIYAIGLIIMLIGSMFAAFAG